MKVDLPTLRDLIIETFSVGELRNLCMDLGIDHDDLPATKPDLARELVKYCERRKTVDDLVNKCKALRPQVSWEKVVYLPGPEVRDKKVMIHQVPSGHKEVVKVRFQNSLPIVLLLALILLSLYSYRVTKSANRAEATLIAVLETLPVAKDTPTLTAATSVNTEQNELLLSTTVLPESKTREPLLQTPTPFPELSQTSTPTLSSEASLTATFTPPPESSTPSPESSLSPTPMVTLSPGSTAILNITTLPTESTFTPQPSPTPTAISSVHLANALFEGDINVARIDLTGSWEFLLEYLMRFHWHMGDEIPLNQFLVKISDEIFMLVPWRSLQLLYKDGEMQTVDLVTGEKLTGNMEGTLVSLDGKRYSLQDVLQLDVTSLPESDALIEPFEQNTNASWQLQILEPTPLTFTVYNPRFAVRYCYGTPAGCYAPSSYSYAQTESFYIQIEDDETLAYLDDLEMISFGEFEDKPNQVRLRSSISEQVGTLTKLEAQMWGWPSPVTRVTTGSDWTLLADYSVDSEVTIVLLGGSRYILNKISP